MKVLRAIDPELVLPDTCDDMPDETRQRLLITMTEACKRYDCKQDDLTWNVNKDGIIRVKKR